MRVKKSLKAPFLHTLYHADRLHLMWCAHGSGLGHSDPRAGRGVMGEEQSRGVNQGGSIEEDYSRIINQGESIKEDQSSRRIRVRGGVHIRGRVRVRGRIHDRGGLRVLFATQLDRLK